VDLRSPQQGTLGRLLDDAQAQMMLSIGHKQLSKRLHDVILVLENAACFAHN
jgi:hypothetical protein